MIIRRAIKNKSIVAGGGATEMEISKYLRKYSRSVEGKTQMVIAAFAKALECIPRQLCDNAGFDATDILNKVSQKHAVEDGSCMWFGVDMLSEDIADNLELFVWVGVKTEIFLIVDDSCLLISILVCRCRNLLWSRST